MRNGEVVDAGEATDASDDDDEEEDTDA